MDFVINEGFGHAFVFYLTARQHWSRFDRNLEIYPLQAPRPIMPKRAPLVLILFLCVISSVLGQRTSEALSELLKQAEQGDAAAQSELGARYTFGQGVPQD